MTDQDFRERVLSTLARLDERTKGLPVLQARVTVLERWRERALGTVAGVSAVVTVVVAFVGWTVSQFLPKP